ncbi:MAG: RecX family transcriptional regulator, partial [Dysgonamonadaceae bacterium]|nr:RecX family transcriptional regulator [Dysgonamonadaceae bacterium]
MKNPEQALHLLAAYCSKAERCIDDVKKKLSQWEIPEKDRDCILNRLQEENFLNEERFCRAYVNDKSKYNQWGTYKIQFELKKKQIPDSLIKEAIQVIVPDENKERLLQLLQTKQKSIKGKDEFEICRKLMRFAVSRGFRIEEVE